MEFAAELGLFAAKCLLIVVAIGFIVALVARAARRGDAGPGGELKLTKLNDKWRRTALRMKRAILLPTAAKAELKRARAQAKARAHDKTERPRIFVVSFDGNVRASHSAARDHGAETRLAPERVIQGGLPGQEAV